MSRKSRRSANKPAQQQNTAVMPGMMPGNGSRIPKAAQLPNAGAYMPIPDAITNQMYMNLGPQANPMPMFAPGAPIRPVPGITPADGPRQYEYVVGSNTSQTPRSTEAYSFAELRSLATLDYGIQLCEQVLLDYVERLELMVEPRPELVGEDLDATQYDVEIAEYKEFFAYPDKRRPLPTWLRAFVRDILELDASGIYVHPNRAGGVYALELIDGATIKPLQDDRGMTPAAPFPAYQQFLYGVPAAEFTEEELIYVKETERSESMYGMSRVEKIMMIVNQSLRKQTKDLMRFTDGTVPAGVIELPADFPWPLDQIEAYQAQFNALYSGNDQQRARVHVLPKGAQFKETDTPDVNIDFDKWLLNVKVGCFGITMAEIAMTENVNRSSGDSQENVVFRRALGRIVKILSTIFTNILKKYFNEDRFIVRFKGFEESEDFNNQATAYSTLVTSGIQSPTQAARAMHLPVYNDIDVPPFIQSKTGVTFLEDLVDPTVRDAQKAAQMAGLQLAISSPGAKAQMSGSAEQEGASEGEDDTSADANTKPSKSALSASNDGTSKQKDDRTKKAEFIRSDDGPNTGMMLAFMLDEQTAQALAIPGGEETEQMHCTLAYLGDINDTFAVHPATTQAAIGQIIAEVASRYQPLYGKVSGFGRFTPSDSSDGSSPIYASVSVEGLVAFREALVTELEIAGYFINRAFAYTPHITLAYVPSNALTPINSVPDVPLYFDKVSLVIGETYQAFNLGTPEIVASERAAAAEYKRWKEVAIKDIKASKTPRLFKSTIIPVQTLALGNFALQRCSSAEDVRQFFSTIKDPIYA